MTDEKLDLEKLREAVEGGGTDWWLSFSQDQHLEIVLMFPALLAEVERLKAELAETLGLLERAGCWTEPCLDDEVMGDKCQYEPCLIRRGIRTRKEGKEGKG